MKPAQKRVSRRGAGFSCIGGIGPENMARVPRYGNFSVTATKKDDTMERRYRLQKNRTFQYVYRRGRSVACRDLVMLYARGRGLQVGFSVSKKVGNAVTRNKVKRRLRECFRPYLGDVKAGLYVVVARPSAAGATFQSLQRDMRYLLKKQSAFLAEQPEGTEGNRA